MGTVMNRGWLIALVNFAIARHEAVTASEFTL